MSLDRDLRETRTPTVYDEVIRLRRLLQAAQAVLGFRDSDWVEDQRTDLRLRIAAENAFDALENAVRECGKP